jgi:hypothetical protein
MAKIGRNDPCPCGSGKKYKRLKVLTRVIMFGSVYLRRRLTMKSPVYNSTYPVWCKESADSTQLRSLRLSVYWVALRRRDVNLR